VLERQLAILLGQFTEYELNGNDGGYDFSGVVVQLRAMVDVPVFTGLPFGHVPDKLTLPTGGQCALHAGDGRAHLVFSGYGR
jgi:muramoyltetrapeptide carboxypeptidase